MLHDIQTAIKRARYFTQQIAWEGHFSPIGTHSLAIPIRNALWLMDLKTSEDEEEFKFEILAIHWMSKHINSYIDSHLIESDEEAKIVLAAFLSRADRWCDWFKLE